MTHFFFSPRFLRQHLWYPLAVFTLVVAWLEASAFDLWIADRLFALQGGQWRWRDAWLTGTVIHEGGRLLVGIAALVLVAAVLLATTMPRWHRYRAGLWYVAATTFGAGLVVNVLKHLSGVDCPWDLVRYGGEHEYLSLFAMRGPQTHHGACFPAGHASAAYAWCGSYYWCLRHAPRWRMRVLSAVLVLGIVFGGGQQLRGAHFVSHDVWTLGICWGLATVLFLFWQSREHAVTGPVTKSPEPVQPLGKFN